MGLPADTHEDLVGALFIDGLTTKDEATELSGRGVGLAAVLASVQKLGGHIEDIQPSLPGPGPSFDSTSPRWRPRQTPPRGSPHEHDPEYDHA